MYCKGILKRYNKYMKFENQFGIPSDAEVVESKEERGIPIPEKVVRNEEVENKKELLKNMEDANSTCMVIFGRMQTGDMSSKKAREVLTNTFIDSDLIFDLEESSVTPELIVRIKQAIADPTIIDRLPHDYNQAGTSIENLFIGALGKIEGEASEWKLEDADKEQVKRIMDSVNDITHDDVIDIKFKNYFIGHYPGGNGKMVTKDNGIWKHVSIEDRKPVIGTEVDTSGFEKSYITQIKSYEKEVVSKINQVILDIKLYIRKRSSLIPEEMVDILLDLKGELERSVGNSIDAENPSLVDYAGSGFEGRFTYTDLVAKEYRYRNLLLSKLKNDY